MSKYLYKQGDVIYIDFSPSVDKEMMGIHPAVVISNDSYNRNTDYLVVVPVTSGGTNSHCYIELQGYDNVYGRVNPTQIHCFSQDRARSTTMDHLRVDDFNQIKRELNKIFNEFCI